MKNRRNDLKSIFIPVIITVLLSLGCTNTPASDSLEWKTNMEEAMQIAKNENKAILVNFTGSDWCKWCFKLSDEVFSQVEFEKYAQESLVLVKLDFPRSIQQTSETKMYNQSLAQKYGIQGFPTILILDSTGKLLAKTGYQQGGAVNYVNHIQSFL
jgi:protein disulfide-isomerase